MKLEKAKVVLSHLIGLKPSAVSGYVGRLDRPSVENDNWYFIKPPPNIKVKVFDSGVYTKNVIYTVKDEEYQNWEYNTLSWRYDIEWLEESYKLFLLKTNVVREALDCTLKKLDVDADESPDLINEVVMLLTEAVYTTR